VVRLGEEELQAGTEVVVGGLEVVEAQYLGTPANERGGVSNVRKALLEDGGDHLLVEQRAQF
jgi:hypothetical protein